MKLIDSSTSLDQLIDGSWRSDYIYKYPPRQAYAPLTAADAADHIDRSLAEEEVINLYVHFPFCAQICSFCNLFTIGAQSTDAIDQYLSLLCREIRYWSQKARHARVKTIYFGGGTPSLLPVWKLEAVLTEIAECFGCDPAAVEEVCLEVSPESLGLDDFRALAQAGFNRVNLGVQSLIDSELRGFGRSYGVEVAQAAIRDAGLSGLSNVCVDLIYGLQGQTDKSWAQSVNAAIALRPETLCTYPLTLRPRTGYAARGYDHVHAGDLYRRYDYARDQLRAAGYMAENHVRYIASPRGGYRQKANHWACENVLGMGAGARSYLKYCDTLNGYGRNGRQKVFRDYMTAIDAGVSPINGGYLMSDAERRRKRVVLGLFRLDRARYRADFGSDPVDDFQRISELSEAGLLKIGDDVIAWTENGARYRDNLVQGFFSEEVRHNVGAHVYA